MHSKLLRMGAFAALGALISTAGASLTLVTDRASLSDDLIDWALYVPQNSYVNLPSGLSRTTANGNGFFYDGSPFDDQISQGQLRRDSGMSYFEEPHDFLASDGFVTSNGAIGANGLLPEGIGLSFSTPVTGIGAQIQPRQGSLFTITISAYSGSILLGTLTVARSKAGLADGSAPFVGVRSDLANITSVVYSLDSSSSDPIRRTSLWANNFSIQSQPVPEPGSFAALGLGVAAFARRRRRG